jgi:hypothetical protein
MNATSVRKPSSTPQAIFNMREFILEKNPMNVSNVAIPLVVTLTLLYI